MVLYRIFRSVAVKDTNILDILADLHSLGTPGLEINLMSPHELIVFGPLSDLNPERELIGRIRIVDPNVELDAVASKLQGAGEPVGSVWSFEVETSNSPMPEILMWQALTACSPFVDGWYWLPNLKRGVFGMDSGTLLDLGHQTWVVTAPRFFRYILEG